MSPRLSTGIKGLKLAGIAAAIAYAGLFTFCGCHSHSMIFPAPPASYDTTLPGLVKIPMPGGANAAGLWLPRAGAKTVILFLHGNGDDLGHQAPQLREIGGFTGCSVLGIDYPGYGLTPGQPSEEGCYAATDAAYAVLQKDYGYTPDNIVVFGHSLGTGPAVDLASRNRVKGLILLSPYTSTFRVLTKVKLLPFDCFDNLAKIDRVCSPLLIVHGDSDETIPFSQGKELFAAAGKTETKRFLTIPCGGHVEGIPGPYAEQYRHEIRRIAHGE